MIKDRSPIWIGLSDLLLCVLSVVIVAVAPHTPKAKGPEQKAEYLVSLDWPVQGSDADVDLWVRMPNGKPVFYASREVACGTLDRDSRGSVDDHITLADGSVVKVDSNKETVTLRCVEAGHYDVAAHLYAFRDATPIQETNGYGLKVHVEVTRLNPQVKTEWAGDVTLNRHWEGVNAVSFDLARDGKLTITDTPLDPITKSSYRQTVNVP